MYKKFRVHAFVMVDGVPVTIFVEHYHTIDQCIKVCAGFEKNVKYDVYDDLMDRHVPVQDVVNVFKGDRYDI